MIEQEIKKLKEKYLGISPKEYYSEDLDDLWERIDRRDNFFRKPYIIIAIFLLIFSGGIIVALQTAKPDSLLYPIKKVAENVIGNITETIEKMGDNNNGFFERMEKVDVPEENRDQDENNGEDERDNDIKSGIDPDREKNDGKNEKDDNHDENLDDDEEVKGASDKYIQDEENKGTGKDNEHKQNGKKDRDKEKEEDED